MLTTDDPLWGDGVTLSVGEVGEGINLVGGQVEVDESGGSVQGGVGGALQGQQCPPAITEREPHGVVRCGLERGVLR